MKKILALILTIAMAAAALTGCAGTTVVIGECTCPCVSDDAAAAPENTPVEPSPAPEIPENEAAATGALKTGLAVSTNIADTVSATAEAEGEAKYDVTLAAVTVDELKNGDIDMTTGKAKDGTDLQSSATIYLAGYVYAIEAAVNNAQHLGAQAGDELVLATMPSVKSSVSSADEADGTAQLDADIAVLTRKDGVITSCYIDSLQAKISFNTAGEITTDLTAPVQTKNELGENYGMVAWGGAIAEWN